MKVLCKLVCSLFLLFQAGLSYASDSLNLMLLPDPYGCHQVGVEMGINANSTLGVLGRGSCESDRPTYGAMNEDVENTFSRILVPFRYSFSGVFKDGYFVQGLAGLEKSEFKSSLGSTSNVTFASFAAHGGYQWFWKNGFNISLMGGVAYLQNIETSESIVGGEDSDVVKFLDKNTKANIHGGGGVFMGWLF